jgi:hypothetical protein
MRIGKKEIPKERIKTVATLCDLCGKDVDERVKEHTGVGGFYDGTEVEVEATVGELYPDGDDHRTVFEIDICVVCFMEKVKPAIEALGCKFRERDRGAYHTGVDPTYYQKVHALDCDMDEDCTCEPSQV